jgi:hypothetical protein
MVLICGGPKNIYGCYESKYIYIPNIEIGIKLLRNWYYPKFLPN